MVIILYYYKIIIVFKFIIKVILEDLILYFKKLIFSLIYIY